MLFDLEGYRLRKLDPAQGTKPLDFGDGGINGSINLDGRFIAINSYHPEHGIVTLTSVPPFPDEDRYDQAKVRAYRKSLVTNDGFGLAFEQEIIEREYYLIEDAVPFLRFTLADGTVAECVTDEQPLYGASQYWRFSSDNVEVSITGSIWLQRAAYTQLTEGGVRDMPSNKTNIVSTGENHIVIENPALARAYRIEGVHTAEQQENHSIAIESSISITEGSFFLGIGWDIESDATIPFSGLFKLPNGDNRLHKAPATHIINSRAVVYGKLCQLPNGGILTDNMILPLLWTRDSYYVVFAMRQHLQDYADGLLIRPYIDWLFDKAWRGTYCKARKKAFSYAWGRAYMANGMPKDNKSFQLDQQIFPFLAIADYVLATGDTEFAKMYIYHLEQFLMLIAVYASENRKYEILLTDETPADDDIPLNYHFSSHILLWHTLRQLQQVFTPEFLATVQTDVNSLINSTMGMKLSHLEAGIPRYFITEHDGKQIYSYATDGEGNHYVYHDANDIPLVMMPLWGFCDKDDPIWRNTIDFAFSDANPGFYDGVLGSVHTPAPWALGDAQELIFCKVIGDRDRYQRVWERVEKAAQWDGALPEAYNAQTYEVVSRHWFAWPNAMIAIADGIAWEWETEGEYAR